ncbi:hypothetical protein CPB84DRAFT_1751854 [Gymnopilus junonius]|uniref:F-box domain-containing protein n=1 Tax=Gymnopilus junonius TaxID=109634 RepID=A0A9P5NAN4_GYMJU|nr:hypothetical protein CPB84DRAFT_1751854 [Gymnopilus junonius]
MPWTLGAVCRDWRRIVMATHRLWSHLYLRVTESNAENRYYLTQDADARYWFEQLIHTIGLHSVRCRSLDLRIHGDFFFGFSGNPDSLISLQTLRLENTDKISEEEPFSPGNVKPRPNEVHLENYFSKISFSLAELGALKEENYSPETLFERGRSNLLRPRFFLKMRAVMKDSKPNSFQNSNSLGILFHQGRNYRGRMSRRYAAYFRMTIGDAGGL